MLDVRQAAEYETGHLPGSVHIELGDLSDSMGTAPGRPTVVMCGHGERAMTAASLLQRAGHRDVAVLVGGARGLGRRHRPTSQGRVVSTPATGVRLGLRANAAQFTLLVAVNALVGGLLGQERTVLPLLAETEFGLAAYTAALTYILAFGATKAVTNFFAGTLADRYGRKPVLVAGWLIGLPVPLLLIWAPSWGWVVAANVLLGVNQGLTWSTTVIMKIDLAGPTRRGLAMGLNEAAGYLAVAGTALATGALAAQYGLRPAPFLLGLAYAALGLGLSTLFVRETREHARHEAANHRGSAGADLSTRQVAALVSYREPALSSVSQAGHGQQPQRRPRLGPVPPPVRRRRPVAHPDRGPRRPLPGDLGPRATRHRPPLRPVRPQTASSSPACSPRPPPWPGSPPPTRSAPGPPPRSSSGPAPPWSTPTLLAAVGDVAHPAWRARAVGVYRLWRDGGFAAGALLAGILADASGIRTATAAIAALTAASGLLAWARMYETHRREGLP